MKKVVIVGGGASGIASAISLKKHNKDIDVMIIEKNDKVGKKILATGNGKCNIGNTNLESRYFNNEMFSNKLFRLIGINDYISFFNSIGLYIKEMDQGRLYPYSESASSVLDILLMNIKLLGIKIVTNCEVIDIEKKDIFIIKCNNDKVFYADKVVVSIGSKAWVKTSPRYNLLTKLGHSVSSITPGLVGLKVKEKVVDLKGIRCKANVKLLKDGKCIFEEYGEIIFKEDGVSGIVIMNASSKCDSLHRYDLEIDLLSTIKNDELEKFIYCNNNKKIEECMQGILPKMIVNKFRKEKDIVSACRKYKLQVVGNYGFNNAQISVGGININEISLESFESKIVKGLYITGEVLDIDGMCGGYNLYFCFSSGIIVGKNMFTKNKK